MTACPLCAAGSGEHDMTRTCCRARFLLALPSSGRFRYARRDWLDRWKDDYGKEAADATQDAVAAEWDSRRAAAREKLEEFRSEAAAYDRVMMDRLTSFI